MKKTALLILLLVFSFVCPSQTVEKVVNVPVNTWGGTEPALLYTPSGGIKGSPLLVFLHGAGQSGTDLSLIYNSSDAGGPAYYIEHSQWPSNFPFTVLSPQANNGWSTEAFALDNIVQYMVMTMGVDSTRVYLTGLSAGGDGVYEYTAHMGVTPRYPAAAIGPMSIATNTNDAGVQATLADKVRVWGFGSESDVWGVQTHLYITGAYGGNTGVTPPGLGTYGQFTAYVGGHCCWMQFYTPTFTQGSFTLYGWFLQYSRPAAALALNYVKLTLQPNGSLSWTVDDTTDVDHFLIQQSNDGKNFETVASTTTYSWL